jgi:hypothetical protein
MSLVLLFVLHVSDNSLAATEVHNERNRVPQNTRDFNFEDNCMRISSEVKTYSVEWEAQ